VCATGSIRRTDGSWCQKRQAAPLWIFIVSTITLGELSNNMEGTAPTTPCYVARARVRPAASSYQGSFRPEAHSSAVSANGYSSPKEYSAYSRYSMPQQPQHHSQPPQQQQPIYSQSKHIYGSTIHKAMAKSKDSIGSRHSPVASSEQPSQSRLAGVHPAHLYNGGGASGSGSVVRSQMASPSQSTGGATAGGNSSSASGSGVLLRRPKNTDQSKTPFGSSSSSRRHGMYLPPSSRASLAVMTSMEDCLPPTAVVSESKPPLPPSSSSSTSSAGTGGGGSSDHPRVPPRTRPKSWTSSLFNAMRANHKSVNFQSVMEEHNDLDGSKYQRSSSAETSARFGSLPRGGNGGSGACTPQSVVTPPTRYHEDEDGKASPAGAQLRLPKPRSRTPSPFRAIIKGLVKGTFLKTDGKQ
jgi:hypothetical protein